MRPRRAPAWPGAALAILALAGCQDAFFAEPSSDPVTLQVTVSPEAPMAKRATTASTPEAVDGTPSPWAEGQAQEEVSSEGSTARVFEQATQATLVLEADGDVLADETVSVSPSGDEVRVSVEVELPSSSVDAELDLTLAMQEGGLFEGSGAVSLRPGPPAEVEVALDPVVDRVALGDAPEPIKALGDTVVFEGAPVFVTGDPLPGAALEWTSRDPDVVAVSTDGVGVAEGAGEAWVVGAFEEHQDSILAEVTPVVASVEVIPAEMELEPGESRQAEAEARDDRDNRVEGRDVAWSSTDPNVAEVDADGGVTGLRPGTAEIQAQVDDAQGTGQIRVLERPPDAFTRDARDIDTDEATLHGNVNPRGQDTEAWFEVSRDPNFQDGESTAVQEIPAGLEDESLSATITGLRFSTTYHYRIVASNETGVTEGEAREFTTGDVDVDAIRVEPGEAVLVPGESVPFEAYALDPDGEVIDEGVGFQWSVQDEGVAEVNLTGTVTAVAPGGTEVRAAVDDTEGVAWVEVQEVPPDVTTEPARNVTSEGAELVGSVNPQGLPGEAWFELAPEPDFSETMETDRIPVDAGTEEVEVSEVSDGWPSGMTLYYRAMASNAAGETVGNMEEFTTDLPDLESVQVDLGERGTSLAFGDSVQANATAFDQEGRVIPQLQEEDFDWAVGDSVMLSVDDTGFVVAGAREGESWISASYDDVEGVLEVEVFSVFDDTLPEGERSLSSGHQPPTSEVPEDPDDGVVHGSGSVHPHREAPGPRPRNLPPAPDLLVNPPVGVGSAGGLPAGPFP